jgi:thioredoxin reductase (NADPH)
MTIDDPYPTLTTAELAVVESFGSRRAIRVGELLYHSGDVANSFFAVVSGLVTIVNDASGNEEIVTEHGPGRFLGELSLLTGQRVYVTARVTAAGEVITVTLQELRRLIATIPEISDSILTAFAARRAILMEASPNVIRLIGSRFSSETLALREFLIRNQLPHQWFDVDAELEISCLVTEFGIAPADYPVALTGGLVLRRATPGALGSYLGLTAEAIPDHCADVVVIGAGPAGLAASMYAASEGLQTLTVEAIAPGGQAGTSSRIENYLGFPSGISGLELSNRALAQARKFGAVLATPCKAVALCEQAGHLVVILSDGTMLGGRSMIVATGAHYLRLDVDRLADLEGAGVYYAATDTEVRLCAGLPVVVVGGGNSAGQAALHLARAGCDVTLVIRAPDLSASMSKYLADRITADPHITLLPRTVVNALHGDHSLSGVTLQHHSKGSRQIPAAGLFSFIGATPSTEWLGGQVATDDRGFIRTGRDIDPTSLDEVWKSIGRDPLPFESSRVGLFAVGDVRLGSPKRVAAAVGEGSAAVRSVHDHLAFSH